METDSTSLFQRNIIIAISGGIAAYKMAEAVRLFIKAGANVQVVMTPSAEQFVTPLTLQALSKNPVRSSLFDRDAEAAMSHIELARWADLILIAPATANTIARLAQGVTDDLLTTIISATTAPIIYAPAMNTQMWLSSANQQNCQILKQREYIQIAPESGDLACGESGEGRMVEPAQLYQTVEKYFQIEGPLSGKKVTITAGPTREAIDPVRYITNRSSGKMGFAIAEAAKKMGANVTLISGPVSLKTPKGVQQIDIQSAQQMHQQALENPGDIFIACAAVADYRLKEIASEKIKKNSEEIQLTLVKNPDIVSEIAALSDRPFTVGFAAETDNLEQYALGKLQSKGLDMIAANWVANENNQGFESDSNQITLYWQDGKQEIGNAPKTVVAKILLTAIIEHYNNQ